MPFLKGMLATAIVGVMLDVAGSIRLRVPARQALAR
jgi:hypothetical protein